MKTKIQRLKAKYRYSLILLKQLVKTDFKLRYQNSVLGYAWSLLKPLSLFLILYIVFVKVLRTGGDIPNFGVYLLIGIVLWNYFLEVTNGSIEAIVGQGELLRKVNFPRYVIIMAGSFSAFINLLFNSVIVGLFIWYAKIPLQLSAALVPLVVIELFIFALALGFLLSALYVRYRDVKYIWEVIAQAAFFATPIMYSFSLIVEKSELAAKVLISNPVAQIMQDARYLLVSEKTQTVASVFGTTWAYTLPLTIVAATLLCAGLYFKKRSAYFAEEV